jgi:hypothetical protein
MFLFKKIVGPFFQPIPLCIALLLLGLFFMVFSRKKNTGKVLVGVGTIVLALFSYSGVSDLLVRTLEGKYPAISAFEELKGTKWIVVLGGGFTVDPALPLSTYLSAASLVRLSKAIRIHNKLPQMRLVFTGGSGFKGFTPGSFFSDGGSLVKSARVIHEYLRTSSPILPFNYSISIFWYPNNMNLQCHITCDNFLNRLICYSLFLNWTKELIGLLVVPRWK